MIVNLTPHEIVVFGQFNNKIATFPPSGAVARIEEKNEDKGVCVLHNGEKIPCLKKVYMDVENLPEETPGYVYIVSGMVLSVMKDRCDLIAPDTGEGAVRDEKGRIVGTKNFIF